MPVISFFLAHAVEYELAPHQQFMQVLSRVCWSKLSPFSLSYCCLVFLFLQMTEVTNVVEAQTECIERQTQYIDDLEAALLRANTSEERLPMPSADAHQEERPMPPVDAHHEGMPPTPSTDAHHDGEPPMPPVDARRPAVFLAPPAPTKATKRPKSAQPQHDGAATHIELPPKAKAPVKRPSSARPQARVTATKANDALASIEVAEFTLILPPTTGHPQKRSPSTKRSAAVKRSPSKTTKLRPRSATPDGYGRATFTRRPRSATAVL